MILSIKSNSINISHNVMKLLLTSFGLGHPSFKGYPLRRMPPINMEAFGPDFIPDYSVLLLFDRFIIDERTYENLDYCGRFSYFQEYLNLITELENSGRLEVIDYHKIVRPSFKILDKLVDADLIDINIWRAPLEEAHKKYLKFSSLVVKKLFSKPEWQRTPFENMMILGLYHDDTRLVDLRPPPENIWQAMLKSDEDKYILKVLIPYLNYITCNLILAKELNATIHDWADIEPLYRKKIELMINNEYNVSEETNKVRTLFQILFPNFKINTPSDFIDLLNDSRIDELRNLITESVEKDIKFDMEFANQTLCEVLKIERKEKRMRSIIGKLSLPIGFIPGIGTPLEFLIEETAGKIVESKLKEKKGWFYLISDITEI